MAQIMESIPNISEGRNKEVIEACVDQIRTTPGCTLLDYSSDESHNRSVITYIGDAKAIEEASVKLEKKAAELAQKTEADIKMASEQSIAATRHEIENMIVAKTMAIKM